MSSKRKKAASQASRHKYTTREIMDLTEKRRLERESVERVVEPKPKIEKAEKQEEKPAPVQPVSSVQETKAGVIESQKIVPADAVAGSLAYILILIALLVFFFKLPAAWVSAAAIKLNTLIAYGSFLVLSVIQGSCVVNGTVLNTSYYNISLQGDLTAFYSIELLIVFALLFAFFQRMTRIKRGLVFISLIPLAVIANIARVVMACGLALNDGPASADRYFHGVLAGSVFVIIIIGLIFLEYISSPE